MRFLISGMEHLGFYELRRERDQVGDFLLAEAVPKSIGTVYHYFGLLPRKMRGPDKQHVADRGNLLWLDIDSRHALWYLDEFVQISLQPSCVVDSGGGYWLYWKLTELVSVARIEEWNQRLNLYARKNRIPEVDESCWNMNRSARLVGTVHEDTGVVAHFVERESDWGLHDPDEIEYALRGITLPSPTVANDQRPSRKPVSPEEHRWQVMSVYNRFKWYLEEGSEEEVHARGRKRAEIEYALVCELIEVADCTDDEIRDLFDRWEPLKHAERKRTVKSNPYGYLDTTIKNARAKTLPGSRPPDPSVEKRSYTQIDRWVAFRLIAEAESEGTPFNVNGACEAILNEYPDATFRTAENALIQLEKSGYIVKTKQPGSRSKLVTLTSTGWDYYHQEGFQRGLHYLRPIDPGGTRRHRLFNRGPRVSAKADEVALTSEMLERVGSPDQESAESEMPVEAERGKEGEILSSCGLYGEHFGFPSLETFGYQGTRYRRHAPRGCPREELAKILQREWIDDSYRINFLGKQTSKLIQFVMDWDEMFDPLLVYEQLFVGRDYYPSEDVEEGPMPIWRTFISQRDPEVQGANGRDPIWEGVWKRWGGGTKQVSPWPFAFGLALELTSDLQPATRTVVDRDDNEVVLPRVGIVMERDWRGTFWDSLRRFTKDNDTGPLTSVVLRTRRSGPAWGHRYSFSVAGDAVECEIPHEAEIDLDAVLIELASEERLTTYISSLPPMSWLQ